MILALLLARQGVPTALLEANEDFDRAFRGDTVHPSTLEMLDDLGLADPLLARGHGRLHRMTLRVARAPPCSPTSLGSGPAFLLSR